MESFQRLDSFRMPAGFRGRHVLVVQLWRIAQATLFRGSPQFAYGFRRALLRAFGARVGRGVLVRPSAQITYPWKVSLGDYAWVGDDVVLYSLDAITIGPHAVVSQRSYLCAGYHDIDAADFPIRSGPIVVEAGAWLATDVFVAAGITVRCNAVVGARSSVFKDVPPNMVCHGSPCQPVRRRTALCARP
ncbi:Galactoside O-acetyltransferase [Bordetella ansorpii]|uniref:Galactoside O-acetyltransferase n=1 Tax=Bordetella ansorpii TaxID=288768 RepID=A0A157S554_9BORD|nr:putative colanic acid biosynthesis acetyltransferase [Bordetella ansorpii]SAI65534.1 Galactoside O-acetyltransferase [Bordetella ansorpii]